MHSTYPSSYIYSMPSTSTAFRGGSRRGMSAHWTTESGNYRSQSFVICYVLSLTYLWNTGMVVKESCSLYHHEFCCLLLLSESKCSCSCSVRQYMHTYIETCPLSQVGRMLFASSTVVAPTSGPSITCNNEIVLPHSPHVKLRKRRITCSWKRVP